MVSTRPSARNALDEEHLSDRVIFQAKSEIVAVIYTGSPTLTILYASFDCNVELNGLALFPRQGVGSPDDEGRAVILGC
jgi:hypothetical protein